MQLKSLIDTSQTDDKVKEQLELFVHSTDQVRHASDEGHIYGSAFAFLERANRFVRGMEVKSLVSEGGLPSIYRTMQYEGVDYQVQITPARITKNHPITQQPVDFDCYPSDREELVERAIIRIASIQRALLPSRDSKGASLHYVRTSVNAIRKELFALGYNLNHAGCKEAIDILNKCAIKVQACNPSDSERVYSLKGPTFPQVFYADTKNHNDRTMIQLSAFHTHAIAHGDYQRYIMSRSSSHKQSFVRWLDTTLSVFWKDASVSTPLALSLIDAMIQYGTPPGTKRFHTARRDMKSALNILLHCDVIANNPIGRRVPYDNGFFFSYPDGERPDIEADLVYDLLPHPKFVSFMNISIAEQEQRRAKLMALESAYSIMQDLNDGDE